MIVNEPPTIDEFIFKAEIYVGESIQISANITDTETTGEYTYYRDDKINDGSHTDRNTTIESYFNVSWELDLDTDGIDDGNITDDDWIENNKAEILHSWDTPGVKTFKIRVCDSMGVCVTKVGELTILAQKDAEPSLSDFSVQDWKEWVIDASGESIVFLILIVAVLILGWAVMRSPTDVEEEAEQAAAVYEVDEVQSYGGILGMDHHSPPPAPGILSKDERRNDSSGYVRPLIMRR